jgi:nucleotide-binding universal stress UspA family protein
VFRKILVALDGSDAARAAFVFATDWARHFDSQLWFIQLTEESHRRRSEIVTDVSRRGRQLANHFSVSGATRAQRDQQLVGGIAEAARAFRADMIIVGLAPQRLKAGRFTDNVRVQLTAATNVPVLIPPKRRVVQVPAAGPTVPAIALGPGRSEPATAKVLAHV